MKHEGSLVMRAALTAKEANGAQPYERGPSIREESTNGLRSPERKHDGRLAPWPRPTHPTHPTPQKGNMKGAQLLAAAAAKKLGFRWAPFMFPFWAPGSDG